PGGRQRDAERRRDIPEKPVRRLNQDAGAVPRVRFAAAGAPVQQVDENLESLLDDAVRTAALDVDDEPHTAGVTLVARIVQTNSLGRALQDRWESGVVGHKKLSADSRKLFMPEPNTEVTYNDHICPISNRDTRHVWPASGSGPQATGNSLERR